MAGEYSLPWVRIKFFRNEANTPETNERSATAPRSFTIPGLVVCIPQGGESPPS